MEFIDEYALLVAVVLPVGLVAGLNVILALSGEAGTLLLPSVRRLPRVAVDDVDADPAASPARAPSVPSNQEEQMRRAA
jgi:hypothetical protein